MTQIRTTDFAPDGNKSTSRYYTTDVLTHRMSRTPEGYLVCHEVPIARTGELFYTDWEVGLEGVSGVVRVVRGDEDLFRPETISSFEGKPVTVDHPTQDVSPENWSSLSKGAAHNVRRGEGEFSDCLVADLIITDRDAIKDVLDGLREVSCGYDAHYDQDGPGRGVQRNIIGNHIALVDSGRCGSRIAIRDKETVNMSKRQRFIDRLARAFKVRDEETFNEHIAELVEGGGDVVLMDPTEAPAGTAPAPQAGPTIEDRFASLEAAMESRFAAIMARFDAPTVATADSEKEDEDDKKDKKKDDDEDDKDKKKTDDSEKDDEDDKSKKTDDSASVDFDDLVARAEILAPGIKLPTRDSAAGDLAAAAHDLRVRSLDAALATIEGEKFISPILAGRKFDGKTATRDSVTGLFLAASEIMKRENTGTRSFAPIYSDTQAKTHTSLADINLRNRAKHGLPAR